MNTGMLFANIVVYFVIMATAATLNKAGQTNINSAADAAQALRPLAGDLAGLLFAAGIIGAGFLAVPILTGSAAYGVSEAFGWTSGLGQKPWQAKQFYGVIAISTLLGVGIDFLGISPIRALFWTAVINGVLAGPLLILIMLIANNRTIMGEVDLARTASRRVPDRARSPWFHTAAPFRFRAYNAAEFRTAGSGSARHR